MVFSLQLLYLFGIRNMFKRSQFENEWRHFERGFEYACTFSDSSFLMIKGVWKSEISWLFLLHYKLQKQNFYHFLGVRTISELIFNALLAIAILSKIVIIKIVWNFFPAFVTICITIGETYWIIEYDGFRIAMFFCRLTPIVASRCCMSLGGGNFAQTFRSPKIP